MKFGKIWKRGKRKFRYAYIKRKVDGRWRTHKVLMTMSFGAWVAVNAIYVKDIMSDAEKSRLMDLAYAGYRLFK